MTDRDAERRRRAAALTAPFREEYPFESRFLDLDGLGVHYVDEGERNAPPVLMVHGNPTWSFHFRHLIRALREERRAIAVDHVGCGLSDKPRDWPYRLADHVDMLERAILALDLRDLALVVHDWGGAIGLLAALRRPERVSRLVILNTGAFTGMRAPWRIRICRAPLLGPLLVRGLNGFILAALRMASRAPARLRGAVREGYLMPYRSWDDRLAALRFVQDIPLSPGHPSWASLKELEEGLPRLAGLPACIVWGERDWCFTPAFREEFERRFPAAEVHRAQQAGHWVLEDAREQVIGWIRDFLARTGGGSS